MGLVVAAWRSRFWLLLCGQAFPGPFHGRTCLASRHMVGCTDSGWNRLSAYLWRFACVVGPGPYVTESALQRAVDYLPMAKPVVHITTRRSAVTVQVLLKTMPVAGSLHRRR